MVIFLLDLLERFRLSLTEEPRREARNRDDGGLDFQDEPAAAVKEDDDEEEKEEEEITEVGNGLGVEVEEDNPCLEIEEVESKNL